MADTLDNISFTLGEIKGSIAKIEGQLSQFIVQMGAMDTRHVNSYTDHETRLRKVEARIHWYAGASAVLGAAIGALVTHFAR
jgi:hypothetical protein